ncbi:MAG: O-antigen ligase family protein [Elusimicrobia bacterium]|nr:O-antigen ligase family protein [Elusimicrobiota bacterium]MDE2510665.1 O-antigen ligase family protein [Elusimicrobiota bacterium]
MTPRRALAVSLAALAFALPLSIAGTNIALGILTLALLWSLSADDGGSCAALRAALRSPVFAALAAYAAWEAISALGGVDPAASLGLWPKDLHKIWVFLAVWAALAEAGDGLVAPAMGAGLGLHALVGLVQGLTALFDRTGAVRAHGFVHPVTYGEILGLGLIAAASFLARPGRALGTPVQRRSAFAFIALMSVALILNETRAVALALAAAFAAVCLIEARWRRRALAAALVVVGVFVLWEVMPTGGRNLRTLFADTPQTESHRSRLILWDIAWNAGLEHPVFGLGSGQYKTAFIAAHTEPLDGQTVWSNAHNLYLHQLAERGFPGLIAILAVLGAMAAGAWRAAKDRADAWALAAWAASAAFFLMNMTETAWQTEQVGTLFLFLWLLGAGPRRSREIL